MHDPTPTHPHPCPPTAHAATANEVTADRLAMVGAPAIIGGWLAIPDPSALAAAVASRVGSAMRAWHVTTLPLLPLPTPTDAER
jgi:hypothetical protein